jgi:hypothetical protein
VHLVAVGAEEVEHGLLGRAARRASHLRAPRSRSSRRSGQLPAPERWDWTAHNERAPDLGRTYCHNEKNHIKRYDVFILTAMCLDLGRRRDELEAAWEDGWKIGGATLTV